jgi:hypothetical protein
LKHSIQGVSSGTSVLMIWGIFFTANLLRNGKFGAAKFRESNLTEYLFRISRNNKNHLHEITKNNFRDHPTVHVQYQNQNQNHLFTKESNIGLTLCMLYEKNKDDIYVLRYYLLASAI